MENIEKEIEYTKPMKKHKRKNTNVDDSFMGVTWKENATMLPPTWISKNTWKNNKDSGKLN